MINRKLLFLVLAFSIFAFACRNQSNVNQTNDNSSSKFPYTKDAKPAADPEIAVIEFADNYGTVKIELYSNVAPKHVTRFKELANEGFYNRTQIHRVESQMGLIQGGDPLSKDDDPKNDGTGNSGKPNVPAEFSDIPYDAGIVGAARSVSSPDSANSQFFIMTRREPQFDKLYTVFGKVVEGQDVVNFISKMATAPGSKHPVSPVIIKSVRIEKR